MCMYCMWDDDMFHMLLSIVVDEFRQSKVHSTKVKGVYKKRVRDRDNCINILYCNTLIASFPGSSRERIYYN